MSLAERRGRSAAFVNATSGHDVVTLTPSRTRLKTAPTIPGGRSRRHAATPTTQIPATSTNDAAVQEHPLAEQYKASAAKQFQLFCELRGAIDDVIADDVEWLEAQYGFGKLLEDLHHEQQSIVAACEKLQARIEEVERVNDDAKHEHETQRQVLRAIEFDNWGSLPTLQRAVDELEREILRMAPGCSLDVPEELLKVNMIQRFIALRFMRQDQLLQIQRHRLAQATADEALARCLDGYNSLDDLLAEMERLRATNERLALREKRFEHDPLLKRRRLRECSPDLLRALVVALQNELSAARTMISQLSDTRHPLSSLIHAVPQQEDEAGEDDDMSDVDGLDVDTFYAKVMSATPPEPSTVHVTKHSDALDAMEVAATHSSTIRSIPTLKKEFTSALNTMKTIVDAASSTKSTGPHKTAMAALKGVHDALDGVQTTIDEQDAIATSLASELREQRSINFKLTTCMVHFLNTNPELFNVVPAKDVDPFEDEGRMQMITGDDDHGQFNVQQPLADHRQTSSTTPLETSRSDSARSGSIIKRMSGKEQTPDQSQNSPREITLSTSRLSPRRSSCLPMNELMVAGDPSQQDAQRQHLSLSRSRMTSRSTSAEQLQVLSVDPSATILLERSRPFLQALVDRFCIGNGRGELTDPLSPTIAVIIDVCKAYRILPERLSRRALNEAFSGACRAQAANQTSSMTLLDFVILQIARTIYPETHDDETAVEGILDLLLTARDEQDYERERSGNRPDPGDELRDVDDEAWRYMDRFEEQLRKTFMFYSKAQRPLGPDTPRDADAPSRKTMNSAEFTLMAKQFGLIPTWITQRELATVFNTSVHGGRADDVTSELNFPEFKEALARIAFSQGRRMQPPGSGKRPLDRDLVSRLFSHMELDSLTPPELHSKMTGFGLPKLVSKQTEQDAVTRLHQKAQSPLPSTTFAEAAQADDISNGADIDSESIDGYLAEEYALLNVLEHIFLFYANSIAGKATTFDASRHANNLLTLGELNLFCRDFRVTPSLITRTVVSKLFRRSQESHPAASQSSKTDNAAALSFPQFVEFLSNLSVAAASRLCAHSATTQLEMFKALMRHIQLLPANMENVVVRLKGHHQDVSTDHRAQGESSTLAEPSPRGGRPRSVIRASATPIWKLRETKFEEGLDSGSTAVMEWYRGVLCDAFSFYSKARNVELGQLTFEDIKATNDTISHADLLRFFRDFSVVPQLISTQEVALLYKASKRDGDALSIVDFRDCLMRAAILAFGRPDNIDRHPTLASQLETLFAHLDLRVQHRLHRHYKRTLRFRSRAAEYPELEACLSDVFSIYKAQVPGVNHETISQTGFFFVLHDYRIVTQADQVAKVRAGVDQFGRDARHMADIDRSRFADAVLFASQCSGADVADHADRIVKLVREGEQRFADGAKRSVQ